MHHKTSSTFFKQLRLLIIPSILLEKIVTPESVAMEVAVFEFEFPLNRHFTMTTNFLIRSNLH